MPYGILKENKYKIRWLEELLIKSDVIKRICQCKKKTKEGPKVCGMGRGGWTLQHFYLKLTSWKINNHTELLFLLSRLEFYSALGKDFDFSSAIDNFNILILSFLDGFVSV